MRVRLTDNSKLLWHMPSVSWNKPQHLCDPSNDKDNGSIATPLKSSLKTSCPAIFAFKLCKSLSVLVDIYKFYISWQTTYTFTVQFIHEHSLLDWNPNWVIKAKIKVHPCKVLKSLIL